MSANDAVHHPGMPNAANANPPLSNSMLFDAPAGQTFDAVLSMLASSATFNLTGSDIAHRTATFTTFDGGSGLRANVTTHGTQSLVQIVPDDAADPLVAQHSYQFLQDLRTQLFVENRLASQVRIAPGAGGGAHNALGTLPGQAADHTGIPTKVWISLGVIVLVVLLALMVSLSRGHDSSDDGKIAIASSAEGFIDKDYNDVVTQLETAGFTNVQTEADEDLITGWLNKENSVERVSVNGDTDFYASDRFPPDAKIVVTYHAFPTESPSTDEESDDSDASDGTQTPDTTDTPDTDSSPSASAKSATITVANNPEFAALLQGSDSGESVEAFAKKYAGQTIEFDGFTAAVQPHGDAKTRFDYLIIAGDSQDSTAGPNFQFRDVNYANLHLTGANVPDTFGTGLKIHVVAKVQSYDSNTTLFQLEPVSTSIRN